MSDNLASRTADPGGHSDFEDTPGHPAGDGLVKEYSTTGSPTPTWRR